MCVCRRAYIFVMKKNRKASRSTQKNEMGLLKHSPASLYPREELRQLFTLQLFTLLSAAQLFQSLSFSLKMLCHKCEWREKKIPFKDLIYIFFTPWDNVLLGALLTRLQITSHGSLTLFMASDDIKLFFLLKGIAVLQLTSNSHDSKQGW